MPIPDSLVIPYPPEADYKHQLLEIPGTKRAGQTAHYRNSAYPLLTLNTPDAFVNLAEYFESGRRRCAGSHPMLGQRPLLSKSPHKRANHFVWWTWDEVDQRRRRLGTVLSRMFDEGIVGGPLRAVGIYSGNCPAWQLIDLTCHAYELVSVSLYDTLGSDTVEYIINHTDLPILFTSVDHLSKVLKLATEKKTPTLKYLVAMDKIEEEAKKVLVAWGEQVGVKVTDIVELEETLKGEVKEPVYPSSDTVATICYTSGTTGHPKGVVLTHGNVANAVYAQMHGLNFTSSPVSLAFLPLAHCYGRMTELVIIARGGTIGYWSGDPLLLLEDMQLLKPNLFSAVPRVLNRIYQAGLAAAALPGAKGALFRHALQVKLNRFETAGSYTHPIWDRIVFNKIRNVLGGRIEFITTGSAPLSGAALNFLKVAVCCEVAEVLMCGLFLPGYGSTENVGSGARVWLWDSGAGGTVGVPHPNVEMKLVDVPEMGYTSEDKQGPRGEICVRGDGCFKEYYKDEASTRAVIDAEGWQHSGDVGEIGECGRMRIIDRVKNLLKLSQGEYVALERVESMYNACPIVAQLYVHGDSLESYLVGVLIPDPTQFAALASRVWKTHVSEKDTSALDQAARDPKVVEAALEMLTGQAKAAKLQGFETIKRIWITNEMLTVENGCMTPTMKLKRKEVREKFNDELAAMYALGEPNETKKMVKL